MSSTPNSYIPTTNGVGPTLLHYIAFVFIIYIFISVYIIYLACFEYWAGILFGRQVFADAAGSLVLVNGAPLFPEPRDETKSSRRAAGRGMTSLPN